MGDDSADSGRPRGRTATRSSARARSAARSRSQGPPDHRSAAQVFEDIAAAARASVQVPPPQPEAAEEPAMPATTVQEMVTAGLSQAEANYLIGRPDEERTQAVAMAIATRVPMPVAPTATLQIHALPKELLPTLEIDSSKVLADQWVRQMRLAATQCSLDQAPLNRQKATIVGALSAPVRAAIHNQCQMDLENPDNTDGFSIAAVLAVVSKFYQPRADTLRAELEFDRRHQQPGETIQSFVAASRSLMAYTSFMDDDDTLAWREKVFRAHIVTRLASDSHRRKVLALTDGETGCAPDMEAIIRRLQQLETSERGAAGATAKLSQLRLCPEEEEGVVTEKEQAAMVQALSQFRRNEAEKRSERSGNTSRGCYRCGKFGHLISECPRGRTGGNGSGNGSGSNSTPLGGQQDKKKSARTNSLKVRINQTSAKGQTVAEPVRLSEAQKRKARRARQAAEQSEAPKPKPEEAEKPQKVAMVVVGAIQASVGRKAGARSTRRKRQRCHEESGLLCPLVHAVVRVDCDMGNFRVRALFDTGAQINVIPEKALRSALGDKYTQLKLEKCPLDVETATGAPMKTCGMFTASIKCNGVQSDRLMVVSPDASEMILNCSACTAFGVFTQGTVVDRVKAREVENTPAAYEGMDVEEAARARIAKAGFKLEDVTEEELFQIYDQVFDDKSQPLATMDTDSMDISLTPGAQPYAVRGPRPIPLPMKEAVKLELDNMLSRGVIEKVSHHTPWLSHLHYVKKRDGRIRIVNDLRKLNSATKRPIHPSASPEEVVSEVPAGSKFFSTLDAASGYWQIPLKESARDFTTFITPWGRMRYTRGTMGLVSAGDEYTRRTDEAFRAAGRYGKFVKIVDDVMAFGATRAECVASTAALLEVCLRKRITLGRKKAVLARPEVAFAGFRVSDKGHEPAPEMLDAVSKFPVPKTKTDLRSFFGLSNQLSNFQNKKAELLRPLSYLLQKQAGWIWTADCQEAFEAARKDLTQCVVLTRYRPGARVLLLTDASRLHGVGFVLMQCEGADMRPLQVGSRALSPTEARYSVVEVEALAVAWAMSKAKMFLAGRHFTLVTDHKPLLGVYNKTLAEIENPRLQRLRVKTQGFQFDVTWTRGKTHFAADALSRNPVTRDVAATDQLGEDTVLPAACVHQVAGCLARYPTGRAEEEEPTETQNVVVMASVTVQRAGSLLAAVEAEAASDPDQIRLRAAITADRWTRTTPMAEEREKLGLVAHSETLVSWNGRILIPAAARKAVLEAAHEGHLGASAMMDNVEAWAAWPGMMASGRAFTGACTFCQVHQASKAYAELPEMDIPKRAWEQTSADFFDFGGKKFLVYADRLSNYFEIKRFTGSTAGEATTKVFAEWWGRWGAPDTIRTDGGPQFTAAAFAALCTQFDVRHELSSPYNPASNGHAEAHVKKAKHIVAAYEYGSVPYYRALANTLNNTAGSRGRAPTEVVFGRKTHTGAEVQLTQQREGKEPAQEASEKLSEERGKRAAGRAPTALPPGTKVRIQDPKSKQWIDQGTIMEATSSRGHRVQFEDGRIMVRGERMLRIDKTQ